MPGTIPGGKAAAATNIKKYGADFYTKIGSIGGKKSRGGGFSSMPKWKVRECGIKGGTISRRRPRVQA